MLFTVDIDQFYLVTSIRAISSPNIISNITFYNIEGGYNYCYLPKELFNMVKITMINFDFVCREGYYDSQTKVINHRKCKWINLVNLTDIFNYGLSTKNNHGIYILQ